ncbi:MAG: Hsp20/alpha crystallin family protein [Candidatus Altiarchaeota archaeon]|nr:Hsp20/alpha crystallin family protein [Candidatus Altiarchaeota archaeon]
MTVRWDLNGFLEPLVHLEEKWDELIVTANLPFVKKEDIEVNVTEDVLEMKAQMEREYCFRKWGTLQKGVSFSSFKKTIRLPSLVDVEKTSSSFNRGFLEIHLPKKKGGKAIFVH